MDRRGFLADFGRYSSAQESSAPPPMSGLEAYSGVWGYEQAAHLLRRAMFGPTYAQIKQAETDGLAATLAQLFEVTYPTAGPIHTGQFFSQMGAVIPLDDPNTAVGASWVNKVGGVWQASMYDVSNQQNFLLNQTARRFAMRAYKQEQLMKEQVSVLEKMTLFWHNHFVTSDNPDGLLDFRYITTLQENSLGNFRDLVKLITLDPAMLKYLNGNENTKVAPNENYARELFELFSIGKGPQIAPGDYTNYTETDIQEAAKVLTGWQILNFTNWPVTNGQVTLENSALTVFTQFFHDSTSKTFSAHFNNTTITNAGANEYLQLVDMIFQQDECARFLCRKFYRWFVYYTIDAETEAGIIAQMAQMLLDNDYQVQPVLEALFGSQHFFDVINRGPMIKNPIDFMMSLVKPFHFEQLEPTVSLLQKQVFYQNLFNHYDGMQMSYFMPPSVAGWKAYYQEPSYYRIWINASTLVARSKLSGQLALSVNNNGQPSGYGLDVLGFVAALDNPTDPVAMIDEFVRILFPRDITATQKDYLKSALLPGLPDYEWTVEYGDYLVDPTNAVLQAAIVSKLRVLLNTMMSMPEFQLS